MTDCEKGERRRCAQEVGFRKQRRVQIKLLATSCVQPWVVSAPWGLDSAPSRPLRSYRRYLLPVLPQIHLFLLHSNLNLPVTAVHQSSAGYLRGFLTPPWRHQLLLPQGKPSPLRWNQMGWSPLCLCFHPDQTIFGNQ